MTKVLNQLLYSSIVFGDDQPSGSLRLESTSSGTKGSVQVVGSYFDFITNTQTGRLSHANTAFRTYTFPDYSGQILVSGIFTDANQLVYSSAAGVYAMLPNTVGAALVTSATGQIGWSSGTVGQVLTIVAGQAVFADLPDTGFINPSPVANQIAYYATIGNHLSPITTVSSRVLLSSSLGALSWQLLPSTYLQAAGNTPLGTGVATQVLSAVGDGSFIWVDKNPAVIQPGTQYRLPYYSATSPGTTLSNSSFLQVDETFRSLQLLNHGTLRFYEATVNGTSYLEFKSPLSLGPSTSWTLPSADGLPGALLQTDGSGNLAFNIIDHGTVNAGIINQITYYASTGNAVSGLPTVSSRLLGSSSLGVPTWMLVKESYLSSTGGNPLSVGSLNQVLVSDGLTNFLWMNAVDITGEVLSGVGNFLAYYPSTGTKVDDTSFLSIDNTLKILNLLAGSQLRLYPSAGTNYIGFQSPSLLASTVWTLPSADGLAGYALTTDGSGNLSFVQVGRGVVHTGTSMTLAYYQTAINEVYPWTNIPSRVAVTTAANDIAWNLLTTEYFSGTSGPLDVGTPDYVLTPDGFGSFLWTDVTTIVGKVNVGQATRLAFYAFNGNQVYGSLWLNNAEISKALELLDNGSLRFYETTSTYYAEFLAASTMTASVSWRLPSSDGLSGQFLQTDGFGTLSWITNKINTGVLTAIPYYSALNELSASQLLIPSGLPVSLGNTLLVDQITGQLSYAVLVQPLATVGEIAVYTGSQTVGYFSNLTWDSVNKLVKIGSGGGLAVFETTNTYSTTITVSSSLSSSTTLTLPPNLPSANGYVVTGETDGSLSFREPSSDVRWQQRGVVTLLPGMRSVTIVYDTPFSQTPTWISTQWSIGEDTSYLPTYGVEKSTLEGFIVRFSQTIPATGTYRLNWQSYLTSVTTNGVSLFFAAGRDVSGYLASLTSLLADVDTSMSLAGSLSSPRSYTCSGSSSTKGYIFGGSSPVPLPLSVITSFVYATSILTDIPVTLVTPRSGAAGVGTRTTSYIAGGHLPPSGVNYNTLEAFTTSSETVAILSPTLVNPSVSGGTATSTTKGCIVDSGLASMEILTYTTQTLAMSGVTFGSTDIVVGANDTGNSKGYFGRDTGGFVYVYDFTLDTLSLLPSTLNSVSGLSSAGNSLDHGYFAGSSLVDSLDFSTGTISTVANLLTPGHMSASASVFQSKGLL